jgi:hypothetical protein
MTRKPLALTTAVLALAAAAPAAASATDDVGLAGAPTLRVINDEVAGLQVAVDRKLASRRGRVAMRITVSGRRVPRVETSGRHGDDFLYAGTLVSDGLQVGRKYTVRIRIRGQRTIIRKVKLHPRAESGSARTVRRGRSAR